MGSCGSTNFRISYDLISTREFSLQYCVPFSTRKQAKLISGIQGLLGCAEGRQDRNSSDAKSQVPKMNNMLRDALLPV